VEQDRRWEVLDVGSRGRCAPCLVAAAVRHRKLSAETFPRVASDRVIGEASDNIRLDAFVAALLAANLPLAVDAYTALSAVIQYPPGVTPPVIVPAPK
jgi:hypothetical protein